MPDTIDNTRFSLLELLGAGLSFCPLTPIFPSYSWIFGRWLGVSLSITHFFFLIPKFPGAGLGFCPLSPIFSFPLLNFWVLAWGFSPCRPGFGEESVNIGKSMIYRHITPRKYTITSLTIQSNVYYNVIYETIALLICSRAGVFSTQNNV